MPIEVMQKRRKMHKNCKESGMVGGRRGRNTEKSEKGCEEGQKGGKKIIKEGKKGQKENRKKVEVCVVCKGRRGQQIDDQTFI